MKKKEKEEEELKKKMEEAALASKKGQNKRGMSVQERPNSKTSQRTQKSNLSKNTGGIAVK